MVPPFSNVRVVNATTPGVVMLSGTPGGMMVRPLPLIVPLVQSIWFKTVTTWLPLKVPPLKLTNAGVTVPVPLKLAVPLARRNRVLFVQMVAGELAWR
jgi:hypothetical protein